MVLMGNHISKYMVLVPDLVSYFVLFFSATPSSVRDQSLKEPRLAANSEYHKIKHQWLESNESCLYLVLPSVSDIRCEFLKLREDNFKLWNERVFLQLGCMDIYYAIRKDEPPKITDTNTPDQILLYERWEKSNRFSVMYIKTKISVGVREHIMEMRDIVVQLKKLEVEMSESLLVHFILNTLLPQYGLFKFFYNTHKDKWSINELMTMCVQEKGRLMMEQGESVMLVMQKKGKKGKSQARKQTNKSNKFATRSSAILDIIHTDICNLDMDSHGQKYFISFIDDYSRYMYLYMLHNKNEALDAFKVLKANVEKQCGKQIKIVRLDKGGEYYGRYMEDGQVPRPFAKFLQEREIVA
ncbi:Retrovirus-related Pol polyprotein from transposon TNT 1-94 [Vitis vinifera]|uniref:Retrovirus-related Pol polyprotein from transposon TNT 1-94 n=1 Tax=Vitis vinifera TaxID=29760 RepID=A0A438FXA7_VITVI|nr:Retrovirus-related Pol polyprotein from transposon TNT 1-94 [Vitis vinifera]